MTSILVTEKIIPFLSYIKSYVVDVTPAGLSDLPLTSLVTLEQPAQRAGRLVAKRWARGFTTTAAKSGSDQETGIHLANTH